jgi:hypothetical protein
VVKDVMAAMDKAAGQGARRADAKQLDGIPPSDGADGGGESFGVLLTKKVAARVKGRNPLRASRN